LRENRDRHGTSASGALVAEVERLFRQQGLRTARNQPYAGGHTLERHGRPADGVHAIQIELCRSLYMHPETLRPHAGLQRLEAVLDVIVRHLAAQPVSAPRLAAE
ncbi:MAG: N-formylglutamate amidohydrolase, partial [Sphingomonadaceae bacterium]